MRAAFGIAALGLTMVTVQAADISPREALRILEAARAGPSMGRGSIGPSTSNLSGLNAVHAPGGVAVHLGEVERPGAGRQDAVFTGQSSREQVGVLVGARR